MNEELSAHKLKHIDQFAHVLICLYFFITPWGVYTLFPLDNSQYIGSFSILPQFMYSLLGLCMILTLPVAILRVLIKKSWPIPLELTWPLALPIVFALFSIFSMYAFELLNVAGWQSLVLILCIPHWRTVRDALFLYAFSGACVALLCVLAHFRLVIPTTWPTADSPLVMAGVNNIYIFLSCAVAAWILTLTRVSPWWMRCLACIFALCASGMFVYYRMQYPLSGRPVSITGTSDLIIRALLFWVVARTAAKAWLRRHELLSVKAGNTEHASMLLGAGVAIITLFLLHYIWGSGLSAPLLLPILIAYIIRVDRNEELETPAPRMLPTALVVLASLFLLLYNVLNVSPNIYDPRNYPAFSQMFQGSAYARDILQSINQLYPGERNTWYWIARGRLTEGDAEGSVPYFLKSLEPGNPVLIKDYPEEMKEAYLAELRDAASMLEQDSPGLPYERVLLAMQQEDTAMTLLQLKADKYDEAEPTISRIAMEWMLRKLLAHPDTGGLFTDWPDEKLYALLRQQSVWELDAPRETALVLSLILQENRVEFEMWDNGAISGGSFTVPSQLRKKAVHKISNDTLGFTDKAIRTPVFEIVLGEIPAILYQQNALIKVNTPNQPYRPFTHRIILILH